MTIHRLSAFLVPMFIGAISFTPAYADEVWTHAGSACVIDESSTAAVRLTAARLHHAAASAGTIYARCNVTNPRDNGGNTGWDRLEVAYRDNDGNERNRQVKATLYRVSSGPDSPGGGWSPLVTFDSNGVEGGDCTGDCVRSKLIDPLREFDFDTYSYVVLLELTRAAASADTDVSVSAVRLLER